MSSFENFPKNKIKPMTKISNWSPMTMNPITRSNQIRFPKENKGCGAPYWSQSLFCPVFCNFDDCNSWYHKQWKYSTEPVTAAAQTTNFVLYPINNSLQITKCHNRYAKMMLLQFRYLQLNKGVADLLK